MKKLGVLLPLLLSLILAGCATSTLLGIQGDLQKIYPQTIGKVNQDMQAILTTVAADQAAGKITAIQAQQFSACPNAVLGFGALIQSLINGPIPDGAGVGWLLYKAKTLQTNDLATFNTQAKLVAGACQAMVAIPGLPF